MTIRDTILAFLDTGVNATPDQIIGAVRAKIPYYINAGDVITEMQNLHRDRWLIHEMQRSVSRYRRRTPDQHAQLMAELDGTQPKLL
jgi:hypothetical protein